MRKYILTACLCFLFPLLCTAQKSMIAVSASAHSTGARGHGIILRLENLETHRIYETKALGLMSDNAVIYNLPAGKYEVCRVEVPFGNFTFWNESTELRSYFGIIEIRPDSKYYLGSFESSYLGKVSQRRVAFSLSGHEMPESLLKYLKKVGLAKKDFIPIKPTEKTFLLCE